jgi:phage terminase large subunit-like protein
MAPADESARETHDWYAESCPCGKPSGACTEHPRARQSQRPPAGDWRVWAYIAGRGAGKTRAGAEWIHHRARNGEMRCGGLIAPTAKALRDVLIDGPSGLLRTAPPEFRPKFESSKRRITWPNGAYAVCVTGEEPDQARGQNWDTIWADELAAWKYSQATWEQALLALRAGNSQALITTTPKRVPVLKRILAEPTTIRTTDSTYANALHLSAEFVGQITALYEGTRLGRQELHAEFLDTSEGAWFQSFDPARHVKPEAEYTPAWGPVHLAIDCGTSQHTGAVFFQVLQVDQFKHRVTVFGDFLSSGAFSAKNAEAIKARSSALPSGGRLDLVRVDPAARAQTGIGPAAYSEYERVFGRLLAKWPSHGVVDGLEFLELLIETDCLWIHPRCTQLIDAFKDYHKKTIGAITVNYPADNQSPNEDMMDALRGGVRDRFPEGRTAPSAVRSVHASRMF